MLDEARTFNLGVAGHLGLTDAVTAARRGSARIEHLSGVPEAASRDPPRSTPRTPRLLRRMDRVRAELGRPRLGGARPGGRELADRKVMLVPTLVLHETFSRLDDPAVLGDTMLQAIPEEERVRWNVPDMIARAGWTGAGLPAFRRSRAGRRTCSSGSFTRGRPDRRGHRCGEPDADPGVRRSPRDGAAGGGGPDTRRGDQAATRNGALLLRVDSLGLVAPGKVADLVILDRDPLADIRNTLSIDRVMIRGRMLSPDSIRAVW